MGLIGNFLVAKLVTKLTERLDRAQRDPSARAEYIPAGAAALALIAAGMSRRRRS